MVHGLLYLFIAVAGRIHRQLRRSARPGAKFCSVCGTPAPWLSRAQLLLWVKHQLRASNEMGPSMRLDLKTRSYARQT